MAFRKAKTTQGYTHINVHALNGDLNAIEYLKYTDTHFVEGLFFFAKRYGRAEFDYKGKRYELVRNRNLTFTIHELEDEEQTLAEAFR